ncbi:outer membrane protein transport protein [Desulfuromonas carbonis]|uniref:OmpP1/FadL family transporter n=1 Tax=Desulfuromonas sp. DDH964 TaxID=1823759 RepID=UPI00078BFDA1|nr:outer membrane protein transport protein [Desulfuromonas sp. DDH964]AMV72190.1 Putative outer membrane protein precursor [Desulfuromonas sp. DDH964]
MRITRYRSCLLAAGFMALTLAILPATVQAAGFSLMEQSVSALGNAFAGGSAIAEDAASQYYNPAGLIRLEGQQASAGLHLIRTSFKFKNEGSTHLLDPQLNGNNGGDAGQWNAVPNAYFAMKVNKDLALGLGINVPFGLTTDYKAGWVGRYHTLKSSIMTININPSVAYAITDKLSIGAGVSAMYISGEFSQAIDFGTILAVGGDISQQDDGKAVIKADDWGYGFNLGVLYQFTEDTRVGAAYRSRVKQSLSGDADFTVPATAQAILTGLGSPLFADCNAAANVTLPATASVSIYSRVNSKLALMGNIGWTEWSQLEELRITFPNTAQPDSATTLSWEDAWQVGAGATYTLDSRWDLRTGLMYDQTPIPNAQVRTPRLPDQDRLWLAFGAGYKYSEALSCDFAYAHLFMLGSGRINMDPVGENANKGGLKGDYDNTGDIFSAQVNYRW